MASSKPKPPSMAMRMSKGHQKSKPYSISSDIVISKLIQHSRNSGSPRLLKYLSEVKKNFSSVNFKLWMDLRQKGGLHAVETVVRSFANVEQFNQLCSSVSTTESLTDEPMDIGIDNDESMSQVSQGSGGSEVSSSSPTNVKRDVFSTGLSVLGNAYSLDYTARKEAISTGFIETLHRIIQIYSGISNKAKDRMVKNHDATTSQQSSTPNTEQQPMSSMECDITMKAVKCVANLARDSECREAIFKIGLGISIIKILDRFNDYFNQDSVQHQQRNIPSQNHDPIATTNNENNDDNEPTVSSRFSEQYKECIRSSVRAIRILSSEPCSEEGKTHLIRFGAVLTIGKVLSLNSPNANEDFLSDVIRALTSLTDRIRMLPTEQIEELVSEETENFALKRIIEVFKITPIHSKLFSSTIHCLTNLSCNTRLAECLGKQFIFKVALEKLKHTTGKSSTELCRLLSVLTKHSSVNQCMLHNSQEIYSTLQILKCAELQEYNRWVLHVYENVYDGSLKALLRNGLLELIYEHFKQEIEDCDYEMLKTKITTLDDINCRVHFHDCQFRPVYRCDSPSYQQVQEEIKTKLQMGIDSKRSDFTESSSSGIDSCSSPSSSPARSWSSDDSGSELGMTRLRCRSRSPTSSISDDDGCYSPVDSEELSYSPTYSESSPEDRERKSLTILQRIDSADPSTPTTSNKHKRRRLDSTFTEEPSEKSDKKSEALKNKTKKIVAMLNILQKATYITPMPPELIRIVPILLSFLVRGIVSLSPQCDKYQDYTKDLEAMNLGRKSFNLSYRILKTICLNINMFPELVKNGTVTLISRLLCWDQSLSDLGTGNMSNLISYLCGKTNDTAGWREGYLLRTLLISKTEDELNKIALAIPLMYLKNDHVLRNFESKGRSWSRVFDLLIKSVDISFSLFQDCILTLSTLSSTIGMKYSAADSNSRPILRRVSGHRLSEVITLQQSSSEENSNNENEGKVEIMLDDGSIVFIQKTLLTEASPVFSAMFDGHFIEAGSQKVQIKEVSPTAIFAMVEQLYAAAAATTTIQNQNQNDNQHNLTGPLAADEDAILNFDSNHYELSTLFELLSISDQFLLESVYERTLNTLLCFYICPYAAPTIYSEAVKLSTLWKPQSRLKGWDMDLTFIVLKYLLVGNLNISSRCFALRKIFDACPASTVVGDMRALLEFYCGRP